MHTDQMLHVQHISVDMVAMFIGERCFGEVWPLLAQSSNLGKALMNLNNPISSFRGILLLSIIYYSYSSMPLDQLVLVRSCAW